jgi:hypothetical protein
MALINTAVGLLAISSPIGALPVVAKAAGGEPSQVRRISRLAVLTFSGALAGHGDRLSRPTAALAVPTVLAFVQLRLCAAAFNVA